MKSLAIVAAFVLASTPVLAQSGNMKGMQDKGMDTQGMDMKGMNSKSMSKPATGTHKAVGVVKTIDTKAGTVTLAHEPVKSMNWPAMNMTFQVKDKSMLDKMAVNKKVEVQFEQRGKEYVITEVNK